MDLTKQRREIVEILDRVGYMKYPEVKKAMLKVKREDFLESRFKNSAYIDTPIPIPGDVFMSAPHMHAIFLSALQLKKGDKVLEVGAGSGVLLAYIKEIVGKEGKVIGTEIIQKTYEFCKRNLENAGYEDVKIILADGSEGLPKEAPFDKIIVSATCPDVPIPLVKQLKPGGILVAPIGEPHGHQELVYIEKTREEKIIRKNLGGVVFVPLKGKYSYKDQN